MPIISVLYTLETTYVEVVHWRRNSLTVPIGKAGMEFICELLPLPLPQLLMYSNI